jgi:sugar lactone lactonase YvrE
MRSALANALLLPAFILAIFAAATSAHAGTASGSLFVTNGGNGTVEQFPFGGAATPFASGFGSDLFGLTADPSGTLYAGTNNGIFRIDSNGSTTTFATAGLNLPRGMAFDTSGNLFVANSGNNTIEKYTPAGVGSVFASAGLSQPQGLAFDHDGNLYAANISNSIEKFTPAGVGSVFAAGSLGDPRGLAFDAAGNLFISNNFGIRKVTPGGTSSVFASSIQSSATGLAFDNAGNLYAALPGSNVIQVFAPDGTGAPFANTGLSTPRFIVFQVPEPGVALALVLLAPLMRWRRTI